MRSGTSWKSSTWTAPKNGAETDISGDRPEPSGCKNGLSADQRAALTIASNSRGSMAGSASTLGNAFGSNKSRPYSRSQRTVSSDTPSASVYSIVTRCSWPPVESEEKASTEEIIPRRLRIVASMPTRGYWSIWLGIFPDVPDSVTTPFSSSLAT